MVVIDASIAYKWSAPHEEYHDLALKILAEHKRGKEAILVPEFILYELGNAWSTKTDLPISKIKANIKDLEDAKLQFKPITFNLIRKAVILSRKYGITVYDASYATLAKEKKCKFITADSQFVSKVKLSYVKYLGDL